MSMFEPERLYLDRLEEANLQRQRNRERREQEMTDMKIRQGMSIMVQKIEEWINKHLYDITADPENMNQLMQGYLGGIGLVWLNHGHPARYAFQKIFFSFLCTSVFGKYCFGMEIDWDSNLKQLDATIADNGRTSRLDMARWRVQTVKLLSKNNVCVAERDKEVEVLISSTEYLLDSFGGVPKDSSLRRPELIQILNKAIEFHYMMRTQIEKYDIVMMDRYTHPGYEWFDDQTMTISTSYVLNMDGLEPAVKNALEWEDNIRAANIRAQNNREDENQRQWRERIAQGENLPQYVRPSLPATREQLVSLYISPIARKFNLNGSCEIILKSKVFIGM